MADVSSIRLPSGATYTIKDQTARNGLENKADKTDTVLETTLSRGRAGGTTVGTASFAFGNDVIASGNYSQAEGSGTRASQVSAHAEGSYTVAEGNSSHAEGMMSKALGAYSHAEGGSSRAIGVNAHSEGSSTTASGDASHTEGRATYTAEKYAHAEGDCLAATAQAAHAEGSGCPDSSTASYINISGSANATTYTFTYPSTSHLTVQAGHIIGMGGTKFVNVVSVSGSSVTLSETLSNYRLTNAMAQIYVPSATGYASHAEGVGAKATAVAAHAEGKGTTASYDSAHAEGQGTTASNGAAHAEGQGTTASNGAAHAEGQGATASGYASHAEGMYSSALNAACHAEGSYTKADTYSSHAEGGNTYAQNAYSHAEGQYTIATGMGSHAEGAASGTYTINLTGSANATTYTYTMSSGGSALKPGAYIIYGQTMRMVTSVGSGTVTVAGTLSSTALSNAIATLYGHAASGVGAHAEGQDTVASGVSSHAEGHRTSASGNNSHAEGDGTIASEANCHAEGQYNIAPVSGCIHIVGNGTADNARSNAHTLDMQGNAWYAGDVSVGTNNDYLLREKNLAERYDATSTYAVGDYCIYGGQLYKCTTAISTAEAWDSTHWTATNILSEGGGGSSITASVSDSKLTINVDTVIDRTTTTTFQEDYSPNGSSWTDTASNVNISDGGYIEAKVDLSAVTGTRENIISFGGQISSWATTSSTIGHYHLYYNPGDSFMNCSANNNQSIHGPATVTPNSVVTIRIDKDGLWVEGVQIVPKYTSRQYTEVKEDYETINAAVQSYINSATSIQVGSAEGNNRSHATYDYIKAVCIAPNQVDKLQVNDVVLDASTKAEQADLTSLDSNLNSKINTLQQGLAIVAQGNVHAAIAEGQYVYVRNHSTLSAGMYKASAAIATNATLKSSNLTAASSGGLNSLKASVDTLNSNLTTANTQIGHVDLRQSLIIGADASATTQTFTLYGGRKFSDYRQLVFYLFDSNANKSNIRNCISLPQTAWASGKQLFLLQNHGANMSNVGGIVFAYDSDTTIKAVTQGSGALTGFAIEGYVNI